jgi:protein phosphatase
MTGVCNSPSVTKALKRFVAREPLRRIHECAFAVLALESEPIDARL